MQLKLINLRKEHKVSQKEMSVKLDLNVDTYGMKERGQLQFNLEEMFKISEIFNLPLEEIFLPRDFINNAIRDRVVE